MESYCERRTYEYQYQYDPKHLVPANGSGTDEQSSNIYTMYDVVRRYERGGRSCGVVGKVNMMIATLIHDQHTKVTLLDTIDEL